MLSNFSAPVMDFLHRVVQVVKTQPFRSEPLLFSLSMRFKRCVGAGIKSSDIVHQLQYFIQVGLCGSNVRNNQCAISRPVGTKLQWLKSSYIKSCFKSLLSSLDVVHFCYHFKKATSYHCHFLYFRVVKQSSNLETRKGSGVVGKLFDAKLN
ncbi:uncharacterized protein LOC129755414 [Uranotaenia lowii]|uniref:uncharacterized protein LOC129755414 n=1 Tax=Uranotaenia lowii TaxID=190385 RepID=UPI00247AF1F2|nr:uncharacterized protein LOC129755414 [Uranotaenia lowii]